MSLFENEREANLESTVAMVEAVLRELGHDPAARRTAGTPEPSWSFSHGSTRVQVSLVERDEFTHLRVVAPVMLTDARVDTLRLYRRLLTLHDRDVYGAAFAARQNEILIVAERSTVDLDIGEVRDTILRVRDYADRYDDLLVEEFGGRLPHDA
ncbi:MAG: hypothetical protein D6689_02700 [Deltaproteobacteria bacterium]|nr:MAG: hypothetical protein D6689_02700 [Deltaproteobacteria bacterium]